MKTKLKIKVRNWTTDDLAGVYDVQKAAYSDLREKELCDMRMLEMQLKTFPQGQILAEADGRIIGYAASLIVQLDEDSPWYSYGEITGVGTFSTHNPHGDTLYGADIAVHPDYWGENVAGKLYQGRKRIMKRYNLRCMVAGGRIPGYAEHAGRISPEEYIEKVKNGELKDMALNAHLKAGYIVKGVHLDYLSDRSSLNYATYLEMPNPHFNLEKRKIAAMPIKRPVRNVRICAAQYRMRTIHSWEEFEKQVEFFVASANEYHCHFLLFPECFTAQLFSIMPPEPDDKKAFVQLAAYADQYIELFRRLAEESQIYIIGGSHPVMKGDKLYNVAHVFTPRGNVYTQDKMHITPTERSYWGITPGNRIYVFNTDLARFAVFICYDIEFPEIARLATLAGAEIIFVPFSTDERKAYMRVRYSAHSRAIENMVYVALAGNVGNLPQVKTFLINYGQAAVLTPSDFAFPLNGIIAESEANLETVVIADLDLSKLSLQRQTGTVRPLRDRRSDLYELKARVPVNIIRAE